MKALLLFVMACVLGGCASAVEQVVVPAKVLTAPDGAIINIEVIVPSGVPDWDTAVVNALRKTGSWPLDPMPEVQEPQRQAVDQPIAALKTYFNIETLGAGSTSGSRPATGEHAPASWE